MKKVLINYGGVILLYAVIFLGIVAINTRLASINHSNNEGVLTITK